MTVALDSNVFIYLLNAHPEFGPKAQAAVRQGDRGVASELVFAEVFSSPKLEDTRMRQEVRTFMETLGVVYVPTDKMTMLLAGKLRRAHRTLTLADALHLATAMSTGAGTFVTNDRDLAKLHISGLKITTL